MLLLADNCCYNGIGVTAASRAMAPPAPRARLGHRLPAPQYPSAVAARTTPDRPLSEPPPPAAASSHDQSPDTTDHRDVTHSSHTPPTDRACASCLDMGVRHIRPQD